MTSNLQILLCGPSGSGKSTIINAIAQSDFFKNATITGNKHIRCSSRDIHYIPVDDNVFGFLSVNDTLKMFNSNQGLIDLILKDLQIFDLKFKKCSLLSKGERERVAIAGGLLAR